MYELYTNVFCLLGIYYIFFRVLSTFIPHFNSMLNQLAEVDTCGGLMSRTAETHIQSDEI